MAAATDEKREEAIPRSMRFMPGADTDQITTAFKERVGKTTMEACLLRRQKRGIRAISKRVRVTSGK